MKRRRSAMLAVHVLALTVSLAGTTLGQAAAKDEARTTLAKGYAQFQSDNFDAALKLFQQILAVAPSDKDALLWAALTSQRLGDYQLEVAYYDQYLEIDPKGSVQWSNRAVALHRSGRYSEVEPSFKKALQIAPDDAMTYMNRGICRLLMGQFSEAQADFLKAQELGKPSNYCVWSTRLIRQLEGANLPLAQWQPSTDGYHTDVKLTHDTPNYLIDMPEKEEKPGSSEGLYSLVGSVGTRLSFEGSPGDTYEYAPGFAVWQGAVINDPEYGVLLENGTQFRYEVWTGTKKVARYGKVSAWKFQVTKEEDITQKDTRAEHSTPGAADKPLH